MNMLQSSPVPILSFNLRQRSTRAKVTKLTLVQEELRLALEELQITREELHQKNQMLEIAYQTIERERQQSKSAHQKNRKRVTSLGIATDTVNHKQSKAQINDGQSLESMNIFVGKIVHDFNNVLTPILAISQLLRLRQSELSTKSQEMLKVIEDNARRGAQLTQQILAYTREAHFERHPLEIAPLLQELVDTVQLTLQKTIHIDHHVSNQPLWLIVADSTELYQVLMNLVD